MAVVIGFAVLIVDVRENGKYQMHGRKSGLQERKTWCDRGVCIREKGKAGVKVELSVGREKFRIKKKFAVPYQLLSLPYHLTNLLPIFL